MDMNTRTWNLTEAQWQNLVTRSESTADILEDGAFVRSVASADETPELHFFATSLNKPNGWRFPFMEPIERTRRPGALIGRAWHHAASGFVEFEVTLIAAAQAMGADYAGETGDFDDAMFEINMEHAMKGTPADMEWLTGEFERLVKLA